MAVVFAQTTQRQPTNRFRYGVQFIERKLRMTPPHGYWRQEHTNAVAALLADRSGATFDIIDPATGKHPLVAARVAEVDIVFLTPAAQARFLAAVPWPGPMPVGTIATDVYGALDRPCRSETQRGPRLNCMTNQFMVRWPSADRTAAYNLLSTKMNELAAKVASSKAAEEQLVAEQAAAAEEQAKAEADVHVEQEAVAQKSRTWLYVGGGVVVLALGAWALSRRRG